MAEEGFERLASRMALLVSDEAGEADNAGRAVGQLARRLGLSGGQLKFIFLAGARAVGDSIPDPADVPDPEAQELRRLLDRSDAELRTAQHRVAVLRDENESLRDALDRARTAGKVARVAAVAVLLAGLLAGGLVWLGPGLTLAGPDAPPAGDAATGGQWQRMALAGAAGATLYRQPDRDAEVAARLPAGTPLPVRQLVWRGFSQWVETQVGGEAAYVPTTEVDLR